MRIGLIGSGQMGDRVEEVAQERGDTILLLQTSPKEATTLVFPELPEMLIDFSHPDNLEKILSYSLSYQLPLVIGTTGYTQSQFQEIKEHAKHVPVMYSANFSFGIMVMNQLIKQAAAMLQGWQIELIEKHHSRKKDAPSGTANMLLQTIQEVQKLQPVYNWQGKKREENQIGVHSIRTGSLPGEHDVLFAATDEIFTIKHESFSNRIFAAGAVEAADWLKDQSPGYYKLEDLLMDKGV
ncbi:4-hydroxy-tetrahydrodipicolinate reductase [Enterococcus faecium]|uniref:4-hydroxy-tetrahydrodipicolinate reductase n=1 Tax=Enterococcus faecium TaxID=1352 RepID=UPI001123C055|nr:4-hydroxy-tetrahydrodipicolinate reductase [Enterococcus faecium]TNW88892.1 4-hydroxy-tetrahydrodipicolinate reductase [Enterococcus faecium]